MSATINTWTARLGFIAGACAVAAWLAVAGTPGTAAEPAASIRLGALVNGELDIAPFPKPVLKGDGLRAGGSGKAGTLRVRNQTPQTLSFAIRTESISPELDRAGWIEIRDGEQMLVRSSLADSHAWSSRRLTLAGDESRTLAVRVWIPEDAPDAWQAGRGDVSVAFSSTDTHPSKLEGKLPSEERNR